MDANRQGFASMRVIVTRPEPDASAFAAMIKTAGMTPVLSPAIEISLRGAPVSIDGVGALAFTSANGVRALERAALPEGVLALPAFAVGPATAEAARQAGFNAVSTATGDVASLAGLIGRSFAGNRTVLHISGSDLAGDLAGLLAAYGIETRRAALYAATPIPRLSVAAEEMLSDPSANDWATFFSPRTVRLFIEQAETSGVVERLIALRGACLSEAVADAARAVAWKDLRVAPAASGEAMIRAMSY